MVMRTLGRPAPIAVVRHALAGAGAAFDVAVVRAAQAVAKRSSKRAPSVAERIAYLRSVGDRYASLEPAALYAPPPAVANLREHHVRTLRAGGDVVDWSWKSGYQPHFDDQRKSFSRWPENDAVHVRLFRQPRHGAPTVIAIHGYRAGPYAFEERAWQAEWLHGLGLSVALFTLPFHALRAPAQRRGTPLFPTADVARTNEVFAQIAWDFRSLLDLLRERGAGPIGVAGMSLGGYTASFLATLPPRRWEDPLAFAVPFIPLSDLTDVVVEHEALRGTQVPRELVEAGKHAMASHRPLGRAPQVPGGQVLVIAAARDRITQPTHAMHLAEHFRAELVTFPGAHLLQFGRRQGFSAIARFLARLGLLPGKR